MLPLLQQEWVHLLRQALSRIQHCVGQLSHEQIWWRPAAEMNSAGIQMRHLCGNLQQWVVDGVPERPNSRDRAAEFQSPVQEPAEQLLDNLCQVVEAAEGVIRDLKHSDLSSHREIQSFHVTVLGAIMHSVPHFVGHSHQIVQLTRMQLGESYQFHWTPDGDKSHVPL